MSLCTVKFKSESVGKATEMNVILPNGQRGPFATLYLLHGLSDDYSGWQRRTRIENYVDELPLIIVMPDGARSFYANSPQHGAYEDFITKDVVGFMDRTFPTIANRGARAIAGLSMGGYGAMMLGLKHPELFSAACSHSGALAFVHNAKLDDGDLMNFAASLPKKQYDCWALAKAVKASRRKMHIRFDCGTEDFLIGHNRHFHTYLDRIALEHEYAEYPGEHNWNYWDTHIQDTLKFVNKHLG